VKNTQYQDKIFLIDESVFVCNLGGVDYTLMYVLSMILYLILVCQMAM